MNQYSITIAGLLVLIITKVVEVTGVKIDNDQVTNFVTILLQIIGAGTIYYGRYRQGDITWYGTKIIKQ